MAFDINGESTTCYMCGRHYGKWKGVFPVSYALAYKGMGRLPICRECIEQMYNSYLSQCDDPRDAVRQMCRKLDLYWSEAAYNAAISKSTPRSVIIQYISKVNAIAYAGKSYDDTLSNEGRLWDFRLSAPPIDTIQEDEESEAEDDIVIEEDDDYIASDDVIAFWGTGYTNAMYHELEQRLAYWRERLPDDFKGDVGTEALIRQICSLELDINRDRAAGKSIDKNVSTLNNLLGSLNLKPAQKKDATDAALENTPLGVWVRKFEDEKPIPEPDPELKDTDHIIKYILVWLYGHLAKMLNIKNIHSKLYEDEIAKLRVEYPEYSDDDDESLLNDIFGGDEIDG